MKVFDRRVVIASLTLNVILIGTVMFYWRSIAQEINYQFTDALTCQQLQDGYTARHKLLEKEILSWDEDKLLAENPTDAEREILQRVGILDSRAGIISALCEAPLTEKTPFDLMPTITKVEESQ